MPDLVAQGNSPEQRWRRKIRPHCPVVIGRGAQGWSVPWDEHISRAHVEIVFDGRTLKVRQLAEAKNPTFFQGRRQTEFHVSAGEHFVIGETTFTMANERVFVTEDLPSPAAEQSFKREHLEQLRYRDADRRIGVLSQLPEIISSAANDSDLFVRLVNVLLAGIRRANTAAIVAMDVEGTSTATVLHWDRRVLSGADFQPSLTLLRRALESGHSVLHLWTSAGGPLDRPVTMDSEGDWAFVTPLTGRPNSGWAIYVAGHTGPNPRDDSAFEADDLREDIKFTELVAVTLANLRQVQALERSQASLRTFLSPVVLETVADQDPDRVLAPRQCDVSVLFCDLRGFSRTSEEMADNLLELLHQVSQALGVTTRHILGERGVVGDFHGDAAMGFWGWPLEQPDLTIRACRAALNIESEFRQLGARTDHPLKDFPIGLGIASGQAVAGKIGTSDQVKVTVFGPVVNLASRLETMTRHLRATILVDEITAERVRQAGPDQMRVRRLAVVRPVGMQTALTVNQLLPSTGEDGRLSDHDLQLYEHALDLFIEGHWVEAFKLLHQVPAADEAKDFLTVFIAQHNRTPPPHWDGVIQLSRK